MTVDDLKAWIKFSTMASPPELCVELLDVITQLEDERRFAENSARVLTKKLREAYNQIRVGE